MDERNKPKLTGLALGALLLAVGFIGIQKFSQHYYGGDQPEVGAASDRANEPTRAEQMKEVASGGEHVESNKDVGASGERGAVGPTGNEPPATGATAPSDASADPERARLRDLTARVSALRTKLNEGGLDNTERANLQKIDRDLALATQAFAPDAAADEQDPTAALDRLEKDLDQIEKGEPSR